MITDSKSGLPLHNRKAKDVIDGLEYSTETSEIIGHKVTNINNSTANEFQILYRSPGGRYFIYDQKNLPGDSVNILQANISLTPINKNKAEAFYDQLSDQQMTAPEAFQQIFEA